MNALAHKNELIQIFGVLPEWQERSWAQEILRGGHGLGGEVGK